MSHEEQQEDELFLTHEDVDDVIEDDGGEPMEDGDDDFVQGDTEPMIKDDPSEPRERPDNAWAGTFLHKPGSSIFALALHPSFPNPPIAVSGGQDDMGFLFSPLPQSAGEFTRATFPPIPLTGHTDSVVAAAFSTDGEYVATGGMDGRVRVWRRVTKRRPGKPEPAPGSPDAWKLWEFITSLEAGGEVQWLQWHPKGPVLAAGCEDSSVWLWNLPSGRTMTVLSSHTMPSTAGLFPPPNFKQLITSSLDSSLVVWNPSTSSPELKMNIFCSAHAPNLDGSIHGITSLAIHPSGGLIAVGGAGGRVRLVALPRGEIVNTLEDHIRGDSVEQLQFIDLLQGADGGKGVVLVSAGIDGKCFVWDATSGRVRACLPHPESVTGFAAHPAPAQHLVTTACLDRTLRTWDVRTGTLLAEHVGHAGVVLSVAVAPAPAGSESPLGLAQAQLVISGGDEGASVVWRV